MAKNQQEHEFYLRSDTTLKKKKLRLIYVLYQELLQFVKSEHHISTLIR
jgi:hypothetical protein